MLSIAFFKGRTFFWETEVTALSSDVAAILVVGGSGAGEVEKLESVSSIFTLLFTSLFTLVFTYLLVPRNPFRFLYFLVEVLKGFSHRNLFFFCFYNVILLEKLCKKVLYSMAKLFFNQKLFHFFCQNVPSSIHSIYGILYTLYGSECRFFTLMEVNVGKKKKRQNMAK